MKKERPIKIHLLGEFSIENKEFQFPNKVKKSTQLIILIAYLIMYRHTSLTKEALIEVFGQMASVKIRKGPCEI